ncbi:MAG TPA: hypothetical protein DCR58_05785 [Idiomarina baltica]|uniref:Uncharacterized protein n=1 Tax=Idiomarina baltica TaxID=190892 RepID=A0A348WP22_9GAMM|nr:hypothetical protein [Idiomarinaceae bacterium]HAR56284.1 hypothetical protein [Idiomarina baltica]
MLNTMNSCAMLAIITTLQTIVDDFVLDGKTTGRVKRKNFIQSRPPVDPLFVTIQHKKIFNLSAHRQYRNK